MLLRVEVATDTQPHIMVRVQPVADVIRQRAKAIRQAGCYCGIFETAVLAYLRNVRIKVPFGTECIDIYEHFIDDLLPQPARANRPWWRFVAVLAKPGGVLMSADKSGLSHPDVNGFAIGRSKRDTTVKDLPDLVAADDIEKYLPNGARRRASDVASEQGVGIKATALNGDSFIDA